MLSCPSPAGALAESRVGRYASARIRMVTMDDKRKRGAMAGRLRRAVMGLLLAAVLLPASVAQASEYRSELTATYFDGQQVAKSSFITAAGAIKCSTTTATGTWTGGGSYETTSQLTFSGCTAFGQSATVKTVSGEKDCHFRWTLPVFRTLSMWTAIVHIECSPGFEIEATVPTANCAVTFGEQSTGGDFAIANQGSGTTSSLLVEPALTSVVYTVYGPGSLCGTTGLHTGGEFHSEFLTKGYENWPPSGQRGIWVE